MNENVYSEATHAGVTHFEGTHAEIHAKALELANHHRRSVTDIIDILQMIDAGKTYRAYECPSLYQYSIQHLKLSEDTAVNFIAIARKSVEVPALKEQIKSGMISTSKARKICSVMTVEDQSYWLELARALTLKELEAAVAEANPKAAVTERLTYVTAERLRLVVGVSEAFQAKLKRAQDLVSNSLQMPASFEQTLEAALDLFLEKRDPVRKAERNAERNASKTEAMNARADSSDDALPHAARRIKPELSTRRKPIAAQTKHNLNLRDLGRCTHRDDHGNRCEQTRWLDFHHRIAVSQGGDNSVENLITVCRWHHDLQHQ